MTWGAVNELGTLTGYHRIIAKTEHPVLIQLLQAVIKDERRHFAFYRAQARMRLARSRQARTITRWALEHLWAPVGTGVRPQPETDFVIHPLFGDADGVVAVKEMEGTLGELPGLEGSRFLSDALRGAAARLGQPLGSGLSLGSVPRADPGPLRRVHDLEAHRLELVAELVRARVVLRRPRRVALRHEPPDSSVGSHAARASRSRSSPRTWSQDASSARFSPGGTSAEWSRSFTTRTAVGMSRSFATASRNRESNSFAAGPRSSAAGSHSGDVAPELLHPLVGRLQRLPGEVHLRPVPGLEREPAEGERVEALLGQLGHPLDVLRGLRHLLAAHLQEPAVHPDRHHRMPDRALGLRDLVLVVRELVVVAPGVHVEAIAQVLHRHRGALDVPPRDTRRPTGSATSTDGSRRRSSTARSPPGAAWRDHVELLSVPRAQLVEGVPGELPVAGEGRDVVVDGARRPRTRGPSRSASRSSRSSRGCGPSPADRGRPARCRRDRRPRGTPACTSRRSRQPRAPRRTRRAPSCPGRCRSPRRSCDRRR